MSARDGSSTFGRGLLDTIAAHLAKHPGGVVCTEIARRFLRVQDPSVRVTGPLVESLLGGDRRFRKVGTHLWTAACEEPEMTGALLFGAAKPAAGRRDVALCAIVRVEGGEERGAFTFVRRGLQPPALPGEGKDLAHGARLVVYRSVGPFAIDRAPGGPRLTDPAPVRIRPWAAGCLGAAAARSPETLAREIGLRWREGEGPLWDARLLWALFAALEERFGKPSGEADTPAAPPIPFLEKGGADFLEALREEPGVYRMKDAHGKTLYVGMSRNLRSRVESYFRRYDALTEGKREMVRRVRSVEVIPTGSVAEALIEEQRSIQRLRPPYNEKVEVQEPPPKAFEGNSGVFFLPSTDPGSVTLLLLRSDGSMKRIRARRNARKTERLARSLQEFFRGEGGRVDPAALALLTRWAKEERDRLTYLEADRFADEDALLRAVVAGLHDPEITAGVRFDII